ncbi:sarcosine oxidase subunit gamma family protein [Streptomyces sp. S.PB5]|uniref:sarcosine oxidase subunit gamma n=1 Tax=Streptomyces sp. S.PB5 TaxID=3020844 RepID=UPI0025AF9307|nr:sarcosine oxidase subunit gamma family protein [Streptomyces sp. S.PB5]MDN3024093.1 sarcosine oxidase subunit gamma family protein [Streptomyces sp. S.PB5]
MTVETPVRVSPLAEWRETFDRLPAGFQVEELPFLTQVTLRVTPGSAAAEAVESALGLKLPSASRAEMSGEVKALWLGPDEWLLVAPPDTALVERLRSAIGNEFATVTDVSAQRTVLSLRGGLTRQILAQGCAIDLDPRVSPVGSCYTTLLAQTGITLVVRGEGASGAWLLVRASFAPYTAAWLVDAATEYGGGAEYGGGTG